jgi:ABC-type sugar transport system permease subunit
MSVIARENMFDFDKLGYGSSMSTLLFLILLFSIVLYLKLGRVDLTNDGGR